MKKSTKILIGIFAAALTLGVAGCSKNTDWSAFPDYYNPANVEATSEKYVIKVQSEGGMNLDGVKLTASRDGAVIRNCISSNGVIELGVTLGEYTLTIDESSLPSGYYLPEGANEYKTNPEKRDDVLIKIPSSVDKVTSSSYALGTIMNDFTFTDCTGTKHNLSNLLKEKKAVVLNFFYTGCAPCRSEFPSVNDAYKAFSDDVALLAVCWTGRGDTNGSVTSFKNEFGLAFPMGVDDCNLINSFGVGAFPTTVVIDRYGLIAYKTTGGEPSTSFWLGLFNQFTSENYVQKVSSVSNGETGDGSEDVNDRITPTYDMAPSSVFADAISGNDAAGNKIDATYRADGDAYSWPFLAVKDSNESYAHSSNAGVDGSYSILHADVKMKAGEVLSFEYSVSSEKERDILYVLLDGQLMNGQGYSDCPEWQTANLYVADADRTVTLSFVYQKDAADIGESEDCARIRNIHLLDSSSITVPLDVMRPAVYGLEEGATRYSHYANVRMYEDGYYHKVNDDDSMGSILYMSLVQPAAWTDLHMDSSTSKASDGSLYYNSIFYMSFYMYGGESGFRYVFNGDDTLTDAINEAVRIQRQMQEPYYLIPVTEDMYDWMNAFIAQYSSDHDLTTYDKEWLEFCFYYDHYGEEDANSYTTRDYTRGLRAGNAYVAYEKSDARLASSQTKGTYAGNNKAIIEYGMQEHRGTFYKFTATADGVYQLRSYLAGCSSAEAYPSVYIMDENGGYTGEQITDALDADQFTTGGYQGFNCYIPLKAGQTIYLKMCVDIGETGYFDFSIENIGTSVTKRLVCVTDGGLWSYSDEEFSRLRVSAIETQYKAAEDKYYYLNPDDPDDLSSPVYIDFIHQNFMIYGAKERRPLEEYILAKDFKSYNITVNGARVNAQELMEEYLAAAKAKDASDPEYGMMIADSGVVLALQKLIDTVCEGGGEGNGWLMFAVYDHHYRVN